MVKQIIKRDGNQGTVIGKQKHVHLKLTASAMLMLMLIAFLKKLMSAFRIINVDEMSDSKRILRHLSWMRFGLFSLAFLMCFVLATVASILEAGSLASKGLFVTSVMFYVITFIPVLFKKYINGWLLRYIY